METKLVRVSRENGLWHKLLNEWSGQCELFGEDLGEYATSSMTVIRPLAEDTQTPNAGVYALNVNDSFAGLCQLNCTFLPGHDGKVLRVRHIVHSPRFDFDSGITLGDYQDFLSELLVGVFVCSINEMRAPYVKFHFKSPAERSFFAALKSALQAQAVFEEVEMVGSWLYIKKRVM